MVDPDSGQAKQTIPDTQPPTVPTNLAAPLFRYLRLTFPGTPRQTTWGRRIPHLQKRHLRGSTTETFYQSTGCWLRRSTPAAWPRSIRKGISRLNLLPFRQKHNPCQHPIHDRGAGLEPLQVECPLNRLKRRNPAGHSGKRAPGTVIGGPWRANGTWWWPVDFDSGEDGWVTQGKLRNVSP